MANKKSNPSAKKKAVTKKKSVRQQISDTMKENRRRRDSLGKPLSDGEERLSNKILSVSNEPDYSAGKTVPVGEPVVFDNPVNKSEKIYVNTNQEGKESTGNGVAVVMNPIVASKLEFEDWPEDAQREEYDRFMQKVKTYIDYWPASTEWPQFQDFLDKDVRTAAAAELNNWIANPVDPEKVNQLRKPAFLFERRKEELALLSSDQVNHPTHYGGDVWHEPIKVIKAWNLNFNLGNTVKYIARHGKKKPTIEGKIEDLKKAKFYLDDEIKHLESQLK